MNIFNAPRAEASATASLVRRGDGDLGALRITTYYHVECVRDGKVVWTEDVHNLITRVGAGQYLTNNFKASSFTAAWYVGLIGTNTTFLTTDTMASHGSWTEIATYSNATRPTFTPGTVSTAADACTVSNSGAVAAFNINGSATVLGCFMVDNSTISGTTGNLFGEVAFGSSRSVLSGDTLNVTITATVTAG